MSWGWFIIQDGNRHELIRITRKKKGWGMNNYRVQNKYKRRKMSNNYDND